MFLVEILSFNLLKQNIKILNYDKTNLIIHKLLKQILLTKTMEVDVRKELQKIEFFDVPGIYQRNLDLKPNEMMALQLCIEASRLLHKSYLRQVCGDKLEDYVDKLLSHAITFGDDQQQVKELDRFWEINGGPWNRFDRDKPFLPGVGEKPLGVGFYPEDLTKEEWNSWLEQHPEDRKDFESNTTIIRREYGKLIAIPYHKFFGENIQDASKFLLGASEELKDGPLADYLRQISQDLITGNYKRSDISWVKTTGFPFEIVFGPIEQYEDRFLGLKSTFEAFIGIPNQSMKKDLENFQKYLPGFDVALAKRLGYTQKGSIAPMVVIEDVIRTGAVEVGRQFTAVNLPNDREIHEKYGSKKILSKTMIEAKTSNLISKITGKIFSNSDANFTLRSRALFILAHEIAHGMGPGMVERNGERVSLDKLLKETNLALEEAKADTLGFVFLKYLSNQGVLSESELKEMLLSDIAAHFVGWRISFQEAHSQAGLIKYNFLKENGALIYDSSREIISINQEKASRFCESLSNEIIVLQNEGDYEKAKTFLERWTKVQPEIKTLIDKLAGIPLEVHPIFNV